MEGDQKSLVHLRTDPLNSLGWPLSRSQSPLVDACNRSANDSSHFSPPPLGLGYYRPARLIPTPTWYLVHHLEGTIYLTLRVCLCQHAPTFLFIQVVRGLHV
ncbi:hypothetical protein TNCV_1832711 [Trichonephila clavipes]|nr:hypothetical protein TNCV_1832711 [Trichonephila clavipes]